MSKLAREALETFMSSSDLYDDDYPQLAYCEELVDTCLRNKATLIDLLSKHPNWDADNYRVHFDADFIREADTRRAANIINSLGWELSRTGHESLASLGCLFKDISYAFTRNIDDSTVNYVRNELGDDAHIHAGSKPTKAVMKLLRQYGIDELGEDAKHIILRIYSEYADYLSPTTIKRHTVLSVNPVDFLRMSHGNSWTSCHRIPYCNDEFGCYSGGCLSYAYDEETMIMYTSDAGIDNDDLTMSPKTTRQLYFWNGRALLGSRLYPQDMDGNSPEYEAHRAIVEKIVAECLGRENIWRKVEYKTHTEDCSLHYPDYAYSHYPAYELSFDTHPDDEPNIFYIGTNRDDIICVVCGEYGGLESQAPVCPEHLGKGEWCQICGEYHGGESYYVDGEDYEVCEYHWNEYIKITTGKTPTENGSPKMNSSTWTASVRCMRTT